MNLNHAQKSVERSNTVEYRKAMSRKFGALMNSILENVFFGIDKSPELLNNKIDLILPPHLKIEPLVTLNITEWYQIDGIWAD